jgi:uncharacterized membrane protein YdjX (TVP38/TMEM64 family)
VSEELARVVRARPELEAVLITPKNYDSWIETHTMRNGRIRVCRALQETGVAERVRVMYPEVREGDRVTDTMIHSKVCVIDDRILRVGSANINNRSMGTDTECDLTFCAVTPEQRERVLSVRNRLLAEHCGVSEEEIAASLRRTGSLIRTVEETAGNGHKLKPIYDGDPDPDEFSHAIEEVADPARPLGAALVTPSGTSWWSRLRPGTVAKIALAALIIVALPLAWRYTPLSGLADPDVVKRGIAAIANSQWAPFAVVAAFVAGGLLAFPVLVLIAVTAATFGPVYGLIYAAAGSVTSALVTYLIGRWLGKEMVHDLIGPRLDRIRRRIVSQGIISVAVVRLVPVAPFTLINLVAGASQIRLQDFLLGTVLGMAPGWIIMSALGHQLFQIITEPTATNIALLGAAIIGWIAVSIGVQILTSKLRRT